MESLGLDRTQHDFQFTRRWFLNRNCRTFREFVWPEWAGKPITYLEIGVFEGMSIVWMLQRILTHPDSQAVGIDPWLETAKLSREVMEAVRLRALHNTEPYRDRCRLVQANSGEILSRVISKRRRHNETYGLGKDSVDLCMVDGDHRAFGMLMDAELCLKVVKPRGWLLFDDVENDHEKKDHVKAGLEMFLERNGSKVKQVFKHRYMEGFEKL